ncbi:MAG: tryptophan tryptophylquinone biosynthesis enzyme MauG, partial [Pseudomonadota bacterium]|nr:tryptophan tryptophylquinone biosynthesis enzyme MauG [Pseudomonadota bacterium]
APYMHNGQYSTLADVVAHYNRGGDKNPGHLSPNMKPLNLSKAEQQDLIEFLKALTGDPLVLTFPQLPVN